MASSEIKMLVIYGICKDSLFSADDINRMVEQVNRFIKEGGQVVVTTPDPPDPPKEPVK